MHQLVGRIAGIALEIADQLPVMATLLQRGKAKLLIQLRRFRHISHIQRVGAHFVVPEKNKEDSVAYGWLRDMVDLLERGDSAEEVLENSRLNMYQDRS